MPKHEMPNRSRLSRYLSYDPETGLFTRRSNGKLALNSPHPKGYLFGSIFGVRILAHRAAWAITHDEWPDLIDHRNRIKTDNRIGNLRAATKGMNSLNQAAPRNLSSAFRGVYRMQKKSRWMVRAAGRYVGCFAGETAAARAYDEAARIAGLPDELLNFPNES